MSAWDRLVGPGASRAENVGTLLAALIGGSAAVLLARAASVEWSVAQWLVACILAVDLAGGVWANATAAARRWYHRAGTSARSHLGFVAAHVHPFVVGWLFRDEDWAYGVTLHVYVLAAAAVVLALPRMLRAPATLCLAVGGIVLERAAFAPTPGLGWFAACYLIKLLPAHLTPPPA